MHVPALTHVLRLHLKGVHRLPRLNLIPLRMHMAMLTRPMRVRNAARIRHTVRVRRIFRQLTAFHYMHLGAADPTAVHPLYPQARPNLQRGGSLLQHARGNSRIHQRPQEHVPGNPRKTI